MWIIAANYCAGGCVVGSSGVSIVIAVVVVVECVAAGASVVGGVVAELLDNDRSSGCRNFRIAICIGGPYGIRSQVW